MPSIQQFARESEDVVITVRGLPIAVTYNPDRITVRDATALARLQETLDFAGVAVLLDKMVDVWDVTGPLVGEGEDGEPVELVADGVPIPFTGECLEALGINFVGEFLGELQAEAVKGPNPTPATRRSRKR